MCPAPPQETRCSDTRLTLFPISQMSYWLMLYQALCSLKDNMNDVLPLLTILDGSRSEEGGGKKIKDSLFSKVLICNWQEGLNYYQTPTPLFHPKSRLWES